MPNQPAEFPRTRVLPFRAEPELVKAVERQAVTEGVTRSEVLREAVRRYVEVPAPE